MKAPLLVLVAGADAATTPEQAQEFERELTKAGVPHEWHVYEGAPHSFFDRHFVEWKDASDDAWRRMLDFVSKHSQAPFPPSPKTTRPGGPGAGLGRIRAGLGARQ